MIYKRMYKLLFNEVTKAIEEIEGSKIMTAEVSKALTRLKYAQCRTEEIYIESESKPR